MIHEYTLVLERLIQLLDDEGSGIYIHVDRNAAGIGIREIEKIKGLAKKSDINVYRKYRVYWGTNSVADTEIFLLSKAIARGYDYYHVLSGADLPIKTQSQIQQFFEKNKGKEFIHFGTEQYQKDIVSRYDVYHFFTRQLGRKRDKKFWVAAETYSLAVQRRLHVDRTRRLQYRFYGGANWCSITDGFARYVVGSYCRYRRAFRFSQNSDEAVMQTIVMDSPYKAKLYHGGVDNHCEACARYIDWERGGPYVFRSEDFDDLMSSECMFARKFDARCDSEIVENIYRRLKGMTGSERQDEKSM